MIKNINIQIAIWSILSNHPILLENPFEKIKIIHLSNIWRKTININVGKDWRRSCIKVLAN